MRTPTSDLTLPDPAADPAEYRAVLLAVVGGRDPLQVLAETPRRIRELLGRLDGEALARRPADGGWSAAEIIGHLLDDEIINAFRLRMTLTAEQPHYPGTEPEGWAALAKPPLDQVWSAWEGLRAYNLWLLRSLPHPAWDRVGLHAEQGPESVEVQFLKNAGHDLVHVAQLERWRKETGGEDRV
jgi:hypothetical protein